VKAQSRLFFLRKLGSIGIGAGRKCLYVCSDRDVAGLGWINWLEIWFGKM